jgi:hypothetical protein
MIKVLISYTEESREGAGNPLSIKRHTRVEAEIDEESMVTSTKQAQDIVDALSDNDKYIRTADDIEVLPVLEGTDSLTLVDFSLDHLEPKIYPLNQSTSNAPVPDLIKPPIFAPMVSGALLEDTKPIMDLKKWCTKLSASKSHWVTTSEFLENPEDFEPKIDPELEKQLKEHRLALMEQLVGEESSIFDKAMKKDTDHPTGTLYNTTGTTRGRLYVSPELRKALAPEITPSREQMALDMQALLEPETGDWDTGIDEWLGYATNEQLGLWHKGTALKDWYRENMQPYNTQGVGMDDYELGIAEPKQIQVAYLDEGEIKYTFASVNPDHKETLTGIGENALKQLAKTTGKEYVLIATKEYETLPCYGMADTEMTLEAYKKRTDVADNE